MDKSIKFVGRVGDRDPLNEGGAILDHGDGRPTLLYLIPNEGDHLDEYREPTQFWKYRADINDIDDDLNGAHAWANAADVARSCGMAPEELRSMAAAGSVEEKAAAILMVAGYYGWENFDSYPDTLNRAEADALCADLDAMELDAKQQQQQEGE